MTKKEDLVKDLNNKARHVHKLGADGTRYFLFSLEEIQEIIKVLEDNYEFVEEAPTKYNYRIEKIKR